MGLPSNGFVNPSPAPPPAEPQAIKRVGFHEASDAHLGGDLVVELGGLFQIVGAQSDVTDHDLSSLRFRMV